jgi:multidrug efflux pump subunit AcrA (membrane-fusion protein)
VIDLSGLKAPGWHRVVAEVSAPAPDDATFMARLVGVMGQVSGARQAVLFAVEPKADDAALAEPRPLVTWPPPPDQRPPEVEFAGDARSAARGAAEAGQVRVFGLEAGSVGPFYGEASERGYIVGVPILASTSEAGIPPRAVVTLLIEKRSKQALQTTMALVEVLAGYAQLHAARQQLRRVSASTAALDLAARLIASINATESFRGTAFKLVNDLSRQVRADRAALGWVRGIGASGAIRVVAVSDTEHIDRRMAMIQKIEAAMDECLDQEQPVLYPPPVAEGGGESDVLLSQAITHAHRELAAADARLKVISLPLRVGDRVVGVVTVESTAPGPADIASVELIQAALDLVAPVLVLRRSDDLPLAARAHRSLLRSAAWAIGPKHTGWKLIGVLLLAAAITVTFVKMPYRVEAPVELQPRVKHIIAAPFDGFIARLAEGVEAGRTVKQGDLLAEMETAQIRAELTQAQGEVLQAQKEQDAYRKAGARGQGEKLGEMQQARAREIQAQAKVDAAQLRLAQARITAPVDGTIIAGDLTDKVGAAVRLGDLFFQVAPLDNMVIVARVSDRDIALIRDASAGEPTRGEVAAKGRPADAFPFTLERIVPLAQPKDGKNTFEVRARLDATAPWLRPGMEGLAKFDTGRRTLLWIGTRRIRDQLRLWLWW